MSTDGASQFFQLEDLRNQYNEVKGGLKGKPMLLLIDSGVSPFLFHLINLGCNWNQPFL